MSPVDFEKWQCRPVEFKGQGPQPRDLAQEPPPSQGECNLRLVSPTPTTDSISPRPHSRA